MTRRLKLNEIRITALLFTEPEKIREFEKQAKDILENSIGDEDMRGTITFESAHKKITISLIEKVRNTPF